MEKKKNSSIFCADMSITTRYGDQGRTQLYSGQDISKADPRTEAVGTLDEAVSVLGIARSVCQREDVLAVLLQLQRDCFVIGSELATAPDARGRLQTRPDEAFLADLDQRRDALEAETRMPGGFVLPGGTQAAAHLDLARCLFRRVERIAVQLWEEKWLDNIILLKWLNRVSDYCWLLARNLEGDAVVEK